ncbi:Uncharacterised protein [Candidatus Bartonella washoeensis]|nr:Uncharacterised protein [Bartonella washoeensis]
MVGDMMRQENNKDKDLTEKEQQLLHEMINTYQGLKMMSRFMKWVALSSLCLLSILPALWMR